MRSKFLKIQFGQVRTPAQLAVMAACEELIVAFCDLMDAGDVDAALELHQDDAVFHDVDGSHLNGREQTREWLHRVRFSFPGRATLHIPSNLRFSEVTDAQAQCRVLIALYEMSRPDPVQGSRSCSPYLRAVVAEEIRFVRGPDGCWRFQDRWISFLDGPPVAVAAAAS